MLEGFVDKNKKSLNNKKEHIIYVGAKDISYNLPGELKGLGYKVKRYKVYDTTNIVSFHQKFIFSAFQVRDLEFCFMHRKLAHPFKQCPKKKKLEKGKPTLKTPKKSSDVITKKQCSLCQ